MTKNITITCNTCGKILHLPRMAEEVDENYSLNIDLCIIYTNSDNHTADLCVPCLVKMLSKFISKAKRETPRSEGRGVQAAG